MSENTGISNPLRSTVISLSLLADNAQQRIRDTTLEPFAFIITKQHPTLPLEVHNYTHRSFRSSSPLSSSSPHVQLVVDSPTTLLDHDDESLAVTLASRSLVTERDTGRVISRSFMKFFNHEEKMAYKPTGDEYAYEIQEKVDGSIINLFWYEPGTPQTGGQWVVGSRSSFSSQQTESAWIILNTRFPSLVGNIQESSLDRTKTYVFELVDNRMPVKIIYPYQSDLVLLAIVGNDGSETRLSKTRLPFRRPKIWTLEELIPGENGSIAMTASNLKRLNKLHRENEEGFVITFWRTEDDVYPQRVKAKLEDYLKLCKPGKKGGTAINPSSLNHLSKLSLTTKPLVLNGPPSSKVLVNIYTAARISIPSFDQIDASMSSVKERLLEAIQCLDVSDDYGGEAWLTKITKIWDRIHGLFSVQEMNWRDTVKQLQKEGYRPKLQGENAMILKQSFDRHLSKMDRSMIPSLKAWFEGQNIQEIVRLVVESVDVPKDLKSTEVIVLNVES